MANKIEQIISDKSRILNADDLMKEMRRIQQESYQKALDFYAEQLAKNEGKTLVQRGGNTAKNSALFEKKLFDYISKNKEYQSGIREYIRDFDQIDKLNKQMHSTLNGLNIDKIIKIAGQAKGELTSKVATGIVGEIHKNLTGEALRSQFTKQVQKVVFDNVLLGTPFSRAREILKDYIVGKKDSIGQLERWAGQITRDSISQYDGQINAMVQEEYELNAYQYVGGIKTNSRPQCIRWKRKKILPIDELDKELAWARSNGHGMIPGTTVSNFAVYRGGYNCRHQAYPIRIEENASD